MADITLQSIIERLDEFSDKDLEKLAHEIRVILDARDENYAASFQQRHRRPMDPLTEIAQDASSWLEFAKRHEVSPDSVYWANKILIACDRQREIEEKILVEQCVDEMVCQCCGHELDCFCGCTCPCHEMV